MEIVISNPELEVGQRVSVSAVTQLGQVRKFEGCTVVITKGHCVVRLMLDSDGLRSMPTRWLYGGVVESPDDRKGEDAYDLEISQLTVIG